MSTHHRAIWLNGAVISRYEVIWGFIHKMNVGKGNFDTNLSRQTHAEQLVVNTICNAVDHGFENMGGWLCNIR
jgi:hypothetical protein